MRHGETNENRERRYLGHYDAPLAPSGRQQAEATAELLAGERITRVYTSDLLRCIETTDIVCKTSNLSPVIVPALRELDFGNWDCKTYEEIMNEDPERAESWYNNPYITSPPGGETLAMLGDRVDDWLHELFADMKADETALLVSHGGPIRWFQAAWLARKPEDFWQMPGVQPAGFITVRYDGEMWINENQTI